MTRPRAPWSSNRTRPATFAKIVSSLPRPAFRPGLEPAAALPHDDRSAGHDVAVVRLDAEPLRIRVAAVAGAALTFFMSHRLVDLTDLNDDVRDADAREERAVAVGAAHALAALLLEDPDLRPARLAFDDGRRPGRWRRTARRRALRRRPFRRAGPARASAAAPGSPAVPSTVDEAAGRDLDLPAAA